MNKITWIVVAFVLIIGISFADDFTGARPLGLGRTFVGIADDANALDWNPAGIASFQFLSIIAGFNKLYLGLEGDNIGIGHFGAVTQHRDLFAYGISWRYLFSDVYYEHHIRLGLARRFGWTPQTFLGDHPLCVGIAVRAEGAGYNEANFVDNPDEPTPIRDDPVFASGTSKWGFSLDAGVLWRYSPKIIIGLSVSDILQPNLSLENTAEGKVPMHIRLGASYSLNRDLLFAGDFRYFKEGSPIYTPHLGVEKWFNKHTIAFRGGLNPDEVAVGAGWRLNREWALEIDYAFLYPLSKLSAAGANSHKFSAMFQIPNPIPVFDLATISVTPQMDRLKSGDEVSSTVIFKNNSGKKVSEAQYAIYTRKPDGTYQLLTKGKIDDFKQNEEREVAFRFKEFLPGDYKLFAAVDDDGSDIPRLSGDIEEVDEGNNVASANVRIFPPPVPTIAFQQDTLKIIRTTYQETEEPIVPVVFFDENKADIAPRYARILDRLAERLGKNPDVVVKVAGYYDTESDGAGNTQIAQQREDAVYNYLLSKVSNKNQIVKDDANDPAKRRAGGGAPFPGIEKFLPMIRHENRRTELVALIPSLTQSQVEQVIQFAEKETKKDIDFSAQAMIYKSILERNPNVMLLLEGYGTANEKQNLLEYAFSRAAYLKQQVKKVVPFYLWNRVFAWGDDRHPAENAHVRISLLPDGVLYEPFEGRTIPKGETIENPSNFVQFSVKADNKITSHRAELQDLSGRKVKQFTVGDNDPPSGMPWDWKMDDSKYIQAGNYYVGHIAVTDELGSMGEAYSETLMVEQVDKVIGVETMLIVTFEFDRDVAISSYYHSRMEEISRRIIELAEHTTTAMTVAVSGHTDIIGLSRRNQELSMERSTTELKNFKIYLRHMLDLPSEAALDKWLSDRKVTLVAEGYGPDRPYTLKKINEDGTTEDKLLGDNNLPEGRQINRRVLVEFRSESPK